MRKKWKKDDIFGGLYVIRESSSVGSTNLSFAATVVFKVGYDNYNIEKRYGLSNCLTDGWYLPIGNSKQDIANHLNKDKDGYRKLTKEEYIAIIGHDNQGFTDIF